MITLFCASVVTLVHGYNGPLVLGRRGRRNPAIKLALHETPAAAEVEYVVGPLDVGPAVAWLERHPKLPTLRMNIVGKKTKMTDEAVQAFLGFVQTSLDVGEPFAVHWDVNRQSLPTMSQFRTVIAWLDEGTRAAEWDHRVTCHFLVLRNPGVPSRSCPRSPRLLSQ